MWALTSRPSSESLATSSRRTSPEEMCGTPSSRARRTPCVPFPPPGGASIRTLTPRAYRLDGRRSPVGLLAVAALGPRGPEAVLRAFRLAPVDVPRRLRLRWLGTEHRLRVDRGRGRAALPAVEEDEDDS